MMVAATAAVELLSSLLTAATVSIHTDTEPIVTAIGSFVDARDGAVFALVVQLQLRVEEIQAQKKQLAQMQQRIVQLTDNGQIQDVEAALVDVASAPAEWRVEVEHDRSRLRAYYITASQV